MLYESINIPLWQALKDKRQLRILDAGCGTGALGELLSRNGNEVTGITYSAEEARVAQSRLARVHTLDLNNLSQVRQAVPGRFDAVIFADVLEHLADPLATLTSLLEKLAPGGRVFVSLPNVACFYVRFGLLFGRFNPSPEGGVLDASHLHFYTLKTARELLKQAGLKVEALACVPAPSVWLYQTFLKRPQQGTPRPMAADPSFQFYGRRVYPIERLVTRLWRGMLANQFVFTCRKEEQ
jgi:SAM-dependent methyltransferase